MAENSPTEEQQNDEPATLEGGPLLEYLLDLSRGIIRKNDEKMLEESMIEYGITKHEIQQLMDDLKDVNNEILNVTNPTNANINEIVATAKIYAAQ